MRVLVDFFGSFFFLPYTNLIRARVNAVTFEKAVASLVTNSKRYKQIGTVIIPPPSPAIPHNPRTNASKSTPIKILTRLLIL